MEPIQPSRTYPTLFIDLPEMEVNGGLGRAATEIKAALDRPANSHYGLLTKKAAKAKLDKLNVPTLRSAIIKRSDGKFVPIIFLAPVEEPYAESHSLQEKGILPLKGK